MSSVLSKRKGNTEKERFIDPESGDINTQSSDKGNDSNIKLNRLLDKSIIFLLALVTILLTIIFAAPAHIRKYRVERLNDRFQRAVKIVEDQRNKLAQTYKQLTSVIDEEEMLKHKEEIEKLHSAVSSKQDSIDKLSKDIEQHQKQLDEVMKQMQKMKDDASNFCSDCTFVLPGTKDEMTCGARANFIINKYGDNEDDVKDSLVKEFPNCRKNQVKEQSQNIEDNVSKWPEVEAPKPTSEVDISSFCWDCKVKIGDAETTCGERAKFVVNKYGDDWNDVYKGLMNKYPVCKEQSS